MGMSDFLWKWRSKCHFYWARITLSRYTKLFFAFAVFHFVVLFLLQSLTLSENIQGLRVTELLLDDDDFPRGIPVIQYGVLEICDGLPGAENISCTGVAIPPQPPRKRDLALRDRKNPLSRNHVNHINITKESDGSFIVNGREVSGQCIAAMSWPNFVFTDAIREDVVTLVFQVWLVGLSIAALINESPPHLIVAFFGYMLDLGWSAFRLATTPKFQSTYDDFVADGACRGVDLLADWWPARITHSIIICAVNAVVLLGMISFSWVLFRDWSRRSFERVAVNKSIRRMYKLLMAFSVCIQLGAFFGIAAASVLVAKVRSLNLVVSNLEPLYVAFLVLALVEVPWSVTGWMFPRTECSYTCIAFFVLSSSMIVLWGVMLATMYLQYILHSWSFFSTLTITAIVLLVLSFLLGIWCRFNFDQGLAHYLRVRAVLEQEDFTPASHDLEASTEDGKDASLFEGGYLARLGLEPNERRFSFSSDEMRKYDKGVSVDVAPATPSSPPPTYPVATSILPQRIVSPPNVEPEPAIPPVTVSRQASATSQRTVRAPGGLYAISLSPPRRDVLAGVGEQVIAPSEPRGDTPLPSPLARASSRGSNGHGTSSSPRPARLRRPDTARSGAETTRSLATAGGYRPSSETRDSAYSTESVSPARSSQWGSIVSGRTEGTFGGRD